MGFEELGTKMPNILAYTFLVICSTLGHAHTLGVYNKV